MIQFSFIYVASETIEIVLRRFTKTQNSDHQTNKTDRANYLLTQRNLEQDQIRKEIRQRRDRKRSNVLFSACLEKTKQNKRKQKNWFT